MLSGIFGSVGTTSYTENIGLIALTGVASRYVVRIGAIILILLSFVAKLGALIATHAVARYRRRVHHAFWHDRCFGIQT